MTLGSFSARRWCGYGLLLISLVSAAVAAPPPTPVIVSPVRAVAFEDRIEALGTLRANESVSLTAAVTETVSVDPDR